jgi:hypothetical protein
MKSSNRKGNWNEIAGTLKHRRPAPADKDVKGDKEKVPLGQVEPKSEKTRSGPRKPVAH